MIDWTWVAIFTAIIAVPVLVLALLPVTDRWGWTGKFRQGPPTRITKELSAPGNLEEATSPLVTFIFQGVGLLFLCALPCWFLVPEVTQAHWLYAFAEGLSLSDVHVDSRPTDCDFMHAPLGNKDCDYKKVVIKDTDPNGRVKAVYVTWDKDKD